MRGVSKVRAHVGELVFPLLGTNWKPGKDMELVVEALSSAREMQTKANKAYLYR